MMFKILSRSLVTFTCSVVFIGCASGAPTDSDIRQAYEKAYAGEYAMEVGGPIQIYGAKSTACQELSQTTYTCNAEIDMSRGGQAMRVSAALRLVRGSSGWQMAQ